MIRSRPFSGSSSSARITVALAGDVMLGRLVRTAIRRHGYDYPWGDIRPALERADLFLVNLECALTGITRRWYGGDPKPFHFRADPDMVAVLPAGRVAAVSLANNHIGDFGTEGLLETVRVLDRAGIGHAGAGSDLAGARAPVRLDAAGRALAMLAAADYPSDWAASTGRPGMHYLSIPPQEEELAPLLEQIAAERASGRSIILSLHWGPNMVERPPRAFRRFARRMVDAGVDVVWGHSAHVPQGIEAIGGRLILNDTGDLIDDYAVDPRLRNDRSALFLVTLGAGGVERLEIVPTVIADRQARLAPPEDAAWTMNRLIRLAGELDTLLTPTDGRLELGTAGAMR